MPEVVVPPAAFVDLLLGGGPVFFSDNESRFRNDDDEFRFMDDDDPDLDADANDA